MQFNQKKDTHNYNNLTIEEVVKNEERKRSSIVLGIGEKFKLI